jgi:predicted tellurium resistance membrane protein TerC
MKKKRFRLNDDQVKQVQRWGIVGVIVARVLHAFFGHW